MPSKRGECLLNYRRLGCRSISDQFMNDAPGQLPTGALALAPGPFLPCAKSVLPKFGYFKPQLSKLHLKFGPCFLPRPFGMSSHATMWRRGPLPTAKNEPPERKSHVTVNFKAMAALPWSSRLSCRGREGYEERVRLLQFEGGGSEDVHGYRMQQRPG